MQGEVPQQGLYIYIYIYKLPNLKKNRDRKLYHRISVSWQCAWVAVACCFQLLLLQLPVPCQHVSLTSWLCRTGMQLYKYRAGVCCLNPVLHLQEESCFQCVKVHLIAMTFFSFLSDYSLQLCVLVLR